MKYYVYRFLDNKNKVLYVGRTCDLEKRLQAHFNNKDFQAVERNEKTDKIQYVAFEYKTYSALYEIFLINLWKPKYNTMDKYDEEIEPNFLPLEDLFWEEIVVDELAELKTKIGLKRKGVSAIRTIRDEENKLFDSYEKELGVTLSKTERLILAVLKRNADEYTTTQTIIRACHISRSTLTRNIKRLTELELVEKERCVVANGITGENKYKSKLEVLV